MSASVDAPAASTPIDAPWSLPGAEVLRLLQSTSDGLSTAEAAARRRRHGPNQLAQPRAAAWAPVLLRQFADPVVLLLIGASVLALILNDVVEASIILAIVVLSSLLRFWQEHRAGRAVERLLALVRVHADVRRDGRPTEIALDDVVPGDVVLLKAGDLVPCDCWLLAADDLQVDEAALTGESFPRLKRVEAVLAAVPLGERHGMVFLGSHVVSGRAEAVAVATGAATHLGRLAHRLEAAPPRTAFQQGMARFGVLLAKIAAVLTAVLLGVNVLLGRPLADSLLFSLALAVGITPQMLPAIVAGGLSAGARRMARKRVIVRRLDAIEDFGAMDVLCTDKTGTLTEGRVRLAAAVDAEGADSSFVAARAALNAALQTGFPNPVDAAILESHPAGLGWRAIDEVPFDFVRKRLSVLVDGPDGRVLVTKGTFESVLECCTTVDTPRGPAALDARRAALEARYRALGDAGFRVLALADRVLPNVEHVTVEDERDLRYLGMLAFADPPKPDAQRALESLAASGIAVRMVTGDNRHVAAHVAAAVGLDGGRLLTGAEVDALSDDELSRQSRQVAVFAELTPPQKERIIEALRASGATVGYLGDGINDAGALHLADVGISVDSAVDVAKHAAAIVLLEKDLDVLVEGVALGRQTMANTRKYVFTTLSANFGNMASMAAASAFLPFLPLLPRQILLLNFLSDLPSGTLAVDLVDPEERRRPQHWDIPFIRDAMIVFGLLSSAFDLLTFAILIQLFDTGPALFRSSWFVGSTLTELAVLLVLRTRRSPWRSRPGTGLMLSTVVVAAVTVGLPYVPRMAGLLGLVPVPTKILAVLLAITLSYVATAELVKRAFYGRGTGERAAALPCAREALRP